MALVGKLKTMSTTKSARYFWGNSVTLQAVANQLKVNINVIRVASKKPSTKTPVM